VRESAIHSVENGILLMTIFEERMRSDWMTAGINNIYALSCSIWLIELDVT